MHLNTVLRSGAGNSVMGGKHLADTWVESAMNPSDDPTRLVDLRQTRPHPVLPENLVRPAIPEFADALVVLTRRGRDDCSPRNPILVYLWKETPRIPKTQMGPGVVRRSCRAHPGAAAGRNLLPAAYGGFPKTRCHH